MQTNNMDKRTIGKLGEDFAAEYLKNLGYGIIERNYRARTGEIDIICRRSGFIHFVEVKTRTSDEFGRPCEAVDKRKRANIKAASRSYIQAARPEAAGYSFDVMEMTINHLKDVI